MSAWRELPPLAEEATMTGTTPVGERADRETHTSADRPARRTAPPVDPLVDALHEDVAAVLRGMVEIKRLADFLEAALR